MTSNKSDDPLDAGDPSLAAMVLAGGVVAAATATLGPAGAVAGALLTPMAAELLQRAIDEWNRESQRKAALVLAEAATDSGHAVEDLLSRCGADAQRLNLLSEAIQASARTALDAKVRMLGGALASGALATDDALIDAAQLRVRVLNELEAPHLKVLAAIDRASRHTQGDWTGASEADLVDRVGDRVEPRSSGVLQPILRTLDSNGLVHKSAMGDIWDEHLADDLRPGAGTNEWTTTIFGREILSEYLGRGGRS